MSYTDPPPDRPDGYEMVSLDQKHETDSVDWGFAKGMGMVSALSFVCYTILQFA